MRRIHDHVVAKRQDAFVERSVQLMRKTSRMLMAEQVRARNSARQQASAAQQYGRFFGTGGVLHEIADMLRCMTGCRNERQLDLADCERIAVAQRLMIEFQLG